MTVEIHDQYPWKNDANPQSLITSRTRIQLNHWCRPFFFHHINKSSASTASCPATALTSSVITLPTLMPMPEKLICKFVTPDVEVDVRPGVTLYAFLPFFEWRCIIKSKGRCISLSLNIIIIDACTCVNIQCSKGNNSKSRQTRVMVHVFCKSSPSVLHLCEVLWKYRADTST